MRPDLITFLAELKRRKVFRVAAVYGAAAFVALQVADLVFPRLGLPDSTDGRLLAFTRTLPSAATEVWAHDFGAAQSRRLFEVPGAAGEARFSPDGRRLAWQSDAEGSLHVYVRDVALSRAPVRVSTRGGRLPRRSSDGRALLYAAPDGAIMAVALGGGGDIIPSPPRTVLRPPLGRSDYDSFELTPDGGFLFRTEGGTLPGRTLILGWTKLLEHEERRR